MLEVKRYFSVVAPGSNVSHMVAAPARRKNPVEGDKTYCGRVVSTRWYRLFNRGGPQKCCTACLNALGDGVHVMRTR